MINWGFSIKLGWFKVLHDEKVQMLTLNSQKLMICSEDNLFSAYCTPVSTLLNETFLSNAFESVGRQVGLEMLQIIY